MKPIIYIAATPIGSLADASPHLRDILQNSDLIICEDTRATKKLLSALSIQNNNLDSLHSVNEKDKAEFLIQKILQENHKKRSDSEKPYTVALVSDAGTPGISDPGSFLIAKAHENEIQILSVPGPSSLVCAIAASGFYESRMIFSGFLSRNTSKQIEEFKHWSQCAPCVSIFFESPQRVETTIKNLKTFFPDSTKISISREISKKFEENRVFTLNEAEEFLSEKDRILGEFVMCIHVTENQITEEQKLNADNSLKSDCKIIAEKYNLNPKDLYSFIIKNAKSD